jgi:large subunit ribosomal protein L25
VREGGVLEQITRELTVEALPGDIPESITHDASGLEPGATLTLSEIRAPANLALVDDPETVIATITAPRLEVETTDEIETETEVVGEGEAAGAEEATADEAADAAAAEADTTSE